MKWVDRNFATMWLVADDGEVLDEIYSPTGGGYVVRSTSKKYATKTDAKTAAEKRHKSPLPETP